MYPAAHPRQRKTFWRWLKSQIATDVPEEAAVCEFECRKPECAQGEFDQCERRQNKAPGELTPKPPQA